jgi:hypothetical protein
MPKKLDAVATLTQRKPVFIEDDEPEVVAPISSEPEKQEPEEEEEPKKVEVKPEPQKPEPKKEEPVESQKEPEASEEEDDLNYLSVPGKKDSAAVQRAKIEGKRRKELEKEMEEKASRIAELEEMLKAKETLAPETVSKPSYKVEDDTRYKGIQTEFQKTAKNMERAASDPKWVRENFVQMVDTFQKVDASGDDTAFVEFRDTYSAKTGLEPSALINMLSSASDLIVKAQGIETELRSRAEEGTLNETFESYKKGVDGTQDLIGSFLSTLPTRAEAEDNPLYSFLNENLADPDEAKRMKMIQKDVLTLLHGPTQYSSDELSKLKQSGQDIEILKKANAKKAEERKKALIPMVAAGLFVLTKFPDIYTKALAVEDEELTVKKVKNVGKKAEVIVKEEKKEESVDLLSQFVKNGGRL